MNEAILIAAARNHIHPVSHFGFHAVTPELALCAQRVKRTFIIHHGIKTADAPQNRSLQTLV